MHLDILQVIRLCIYLNPLFGPVCLFVFLMTQLLQGKEHLITAQWVEVQVPHLASTGTQGGD